MMGNAWPLKRAASMNDSNCVLSPISAIATMPNEANKASTW